MNDTDSRATEATGAGAEAGGDALPAALRLTPAEARVLACLVEKEALLPDQYPLTENALTLACNQKTSRDPVMELSNGEVGYALRQLEARQLTRHQYGSRAQRWSHRMAQGYELTEAQQAVLCILMLRGPQTPGEILARGERIGRFGEAEGVRHALERLAQRQPPLALCLPRASGQREDRWAHLLCGPVDATALQASLAAATPAPAATAATASAIDALDERVTALEARLAALEARLGDAPQRHD